MCSVTGLPKSVQSQVDQLICSIREKDIGGVERLLNEIGPVDLRDRDGFTPLHAAAEVDSPEITQILLERGTNWAMTDANLGLTAGDVAFSLNNKDVYQRILDHAVRAEMLRHALGLGSILSERPESPDSSSEGEGTAQDETEYAQAPQGASATSTATTTSKFLGSKLVFKQNSDGQEVCLDAEGNGVMMNWEQGIMKATAAALCSGLSRPRILNIGHGLGVIDREFQLCSPSSHVIVEPHPDVLSHMAAEWGRKPDVTIFAGTWQEYLSRPRFTEEPAGFDVVYFDTFSEDYAALTEFFDAVPSLLSGPGARFSFFHGLGATSRLLYDVCTSLSEIHLRDLGLEVEWEEVPVTTGEITWEGVKRRYWDLAAAYRLPIACLPA